MRNQEVIWTALPNGRKADVFKLSVHVAPRLITDEGLPAPRLMGFKDFLNWPANALAFMVKLGGGAAVKANIVTAPPASNDLWIALFRPDTFVRPHKFDAMLDRKVRSYPVRHIRNFVRDLYTQLVMASPSDHPEFGRLMSPGDGPRQRSFRDISFVDPASLKEDRKGFLLNQLESRFPIVDRETQRRGGAIPFNPNDPPVLSFLQLEKFHQPPPTVFRLPSMGDVSKVTVLKWLISAGDAVAIDQPLAEVQTPAGPRILKSPWAGTVVRINTVPGAVISVGAPLLAEPGAPGAAAVTMTRDFVKKLDAFNQKPTLKESGPDGAFDFHQMLSFAASHPTLMRLLGLVIDLEFKPAPPVPSGPSTVQLNVSWKPQLATSKDFFPITRCIIDAAGFKTAARGVDPELVGGALPLENQDRYEIVEIDHDGGGLKTMHFADNLGRSRLPEHLSDDTPKSYAPPALRSGGLAVARVGHASRLVQSFQRSKNLNDAFKTGPIVLDAEDVTRGFVFHVFDSKTQKWHSLSERTGTYEFLNKPETVPVEDEATIIIGPTSSFDGSSPDLYQQETLFRWAGWSLAGPRPGNAMVLDPAHDPGGHSQRIDSVAAEDFRLQLRFKARKGSLPALRFGVGYRIRARGVDLAGNRPEFGDPKAPDPHATRLVTYARFEPVDTPFLLLRLPRTMGESVERMVIRSNFNEAATADNQRHLSAPKTSELMAEEHGLFDTPAGLDKNAFGLIRDRENKSYQDSTQGQKDPLDFQDSRFFDVDDLTLPFLPDPVAQGAAFVGLPGAAAGDVLRMGFLPSGKAWPNYANIRLILEEGASAKSMPSADGRILRISLPKAEVVTVRYSCFLSASDLNKMGIWLWLDEKDRTGLQAAALRGQLWSLTPARELVLVHAVRQPLKTPEFDRLAAGKLLGQTFASLAGVMSFSRKSTATVKVFATWPEAIDEGPGTKDPTGPPPLKPHRQDKGFAVDVPLDVGFGAGGKPPEDQASFGGLHHEFHDTKYRRVTYTAVASTKFGEYFAKRAKVTLTGTASKKIDVGFVPGTVRVTALDLTATFNLNKDYTLDYAKGTIARIDGGGIKDGDTVWLVYQHPPTTRETEKPIPIDVLNSARPDAPKLLYVIPTWGFTQRKGARGTIRSQREGGSLRVYMERPWWSSGDGELLGVVLFRPAGIFDFVPSEGLKPFVTQWGVDPIHGTGQTSLFPTRERFPAREVEPDRLLTLEERPELVHVAGHRVDFDPDRKLWFCDIDVTTDRTYWPFIRLALARYQPNSVANAHLSRIVLADFAQIAPDRTVLITFNSVDATRFRVSVVGLSFTGTRDASGGFRGGPGVIRAHIEQRSDKFAGDLAWETVGEPVTLSSSPLQGGGTIWERDMQMPRRKWPFRLVLEETEVLGADARAPDGDADKPVQRMVFTDVLPLTADELGILTLSPTSLDFGGRRVGTPSPQRTVGIENVGNAPLHMGDVRIEGADAGDFAIGSDGVSRKTLNPGGKASVRVRFVPTKRGPRSARLRIPSDGVGTGTVELTGVGQSPELEITPTALDYGARRVGVTSEPKTITLRNTGNFDLTLGVIDIQGTNKGDFDIVTDPSLQVVPPGGQVNLDITFTPGALGFRNATVLIPNDAPGNPHTAVLRGVGGIPKAGVSPSALDFGNQLVGTESASKVVTVSNTGTGPMTVTSVDIIGANASEFFVFADMASGDIPPGASGTIQVRFFPLATGVRNATLRIDHDAPGGPLQVSLKGVGIAPAVSLQPTSIDFGDQRVGTDSPVKTVTVKNVGTADLHIAFIDFAGPAADDYSLGTDTATGATLSPGKTASFQLIFSPSAAGARDATVLVADDAADSPQSVAVTGKGITPVASAAPTSLNFGNQDLGVDSAPRTVTLTNTGDADLHVLGVDINGLSPLDFLFGADGLTGLTIAPGASGTVQIIFSPTSRGPKSASLQITHDAVGFLTGIALTGVGVGPPGVT